MYLYNFLSLDLYLYRMNKVAHFLLALIILAGVTTKAQENNHREKFDYGWKFKLGDYPEASQ